MTREGMKPLKEKNLSKRAEYLFSLGRNASLDLLTGNEVKSPDSLTRAAFIKASAGLRLSLLPCVEQDHVEPEDSKAALAFVEQNDAEPEDSNLEVDPDPGLDAEPQDGSDFEPEFEPENHDEPETEPEPEPELGLEPEFE
ncbi:MAG: hypothetical protein HC898_04790, partial [Phycisphaerales bacterium]|nr:hypothetical protein [Phycisphaerales bacterium]